MTTDSSDASAHQLAAAARLQRSRRRWRVVAFLALIVAVLALAGRFAMEKGIGGQQIARVDISGTIGTDRDRVALLKKLGDDSNVKAVLVTINTPGGTTAGGEELYESLGTLRAKKPVVAVISELGASAAYMTAIASDRIYARRLSIVGSIGVLFETVNAGKLLDTIGIGMEKIASGPLKAEPDINKPMSPEVRASLTALVTDSFNWFVDIVAERRGLARPDALALADGRILTGRQALDAKLIDGIGGEDDAVAWLEAQKHVPHGLPVVKRFPQPDPGWGGVGKWLGSEARAALGLGPDGPVALDGLVSLWQVGS
ncbi:MAG: signal peptide peptidase SppA [Devosia sp.]|nr:signal peptide peptidase SppA [Devosia sp.]